MEYDDFINEVKKSADIDSKENAVNAVRITLETLSEHLKSSQSEQLASKLPAGIDRYLKSKKSGEDFTVEDFFRRVSDREMVEIPVAMLHVRSVFEVLKKTLPKNTVNELREELPGDFNTLFLREDDYPGLLDSQPDEAGS